MVSVKITTSGCNVFDNGKVYKFSSGGRFIEESNILREMSGGLELPVLSVLSSNYETEIACFTKGSQMKRYSTTMTGSQVAGKLQMKGGFIRMLMRNGVDNEKKYSQLIFIYREDTDLNKYLQELQVQEVG